MSTTPAPPPEVAGCVIRPPSDAEWPACRMLLPHAFRAGMAPEGLLAFVGGGAIGGAAAFRISEGLLHDLAIRVPRPCRRRGIGSRLLERVCELAAARGLSAIHAVVDATAEPGAALFLEARGFVCEHRFRLVEGDVHRLRDRIIPLRDRLRACGRIPPGARIAGPSG